MDKVDRSRRSYNVTLTEAVVQGGCSYAENVRKTITPQVERPEREVTAFYRVDAEQERRCKLCVV